MVRSADFTVFDFETTGLDPSSGHRIVEIGAIRRGRDGTERAFQSLVNPLRDIPEVATQIHGITHEMVTASPPIHEVLPQFMSFLGGSVIIAHNANFDLRFLSFALKACDLPVPGNICLDSVRLSRRFYPNLDSYALSALRRVFDLDCENEHRALSDVRATLAVFDRCLEKAKQEGLDSVEKLVEAQGGAINFPLPEPRAEAILPYQHIQSLMKGLDEGVPIVIHYVDAKGVVSARTITPKSFLRNGETVYLLAFCHDRNAERTFRMDRIKFDD